MYAPNFKISPYLMSMLLKIDKLKNEISALTLTEGALKGLRDASIVKKCHYSTLIEGNKLSRQEVAALLYDDKRFPKMERDEKEVLGCFAALNMVEGLAVSNASLSEEALRKIHGLVMAGGKKDVGVSPYRDGQNVIRDSRSGGIVYLPPEAPDVPRLMSDLIQWLIEAKKNDFPAPISAAIAHYQFATIHPYYDGNGRTARLFTDWVLYSNGYGVVDICALEEYYVRDLQAYYDAIAIGPSHNYYFGREETDITSWIEYFCEGMLEGFQVALNQAKKAMRREFREVLLERGRLSKSQSALLEFFNYHDTLTAHDVEHLLRVSGRTARDRVKKWVDEGFLVVDNPSKKKRSYRLSGAFKKSAGLRQHF